VSALLALCGQSPRAESPRSADRKPMRLAVIPLPNHSAVYDLPRGLEIHGVTESTVSIAATDDELAQLVALGYSPRITLDDYQSWVDSVLLGYRSYAQVCSTMAELAEDYPFICRLDTLGLSVQNRTILMMRVTDNPQVEEAEPEFRVLGPHHGNEKIASEIALSFLQHLLASYDTSPAIRDMVDATELWVIPIVNVDGHVANSRSNANGVDLNRDYGYRWGGMGRSPSPFSQVETRLVRQHSIDNNIAIEFEYHSTASYVNYLWDNHPADPPDSGFIAALAAEYADSTYGSGTTELEPINGYDWYEVDGSCQDASFGLFGNIAYTIETRQPSAQARIDSICVANRRALLAMIQAAGRGVSGTVRDSATRTPLFARISIDSPFRWDCYTDPALGDFHKPLPAGTYTLTAHARGYFPKSVTGIIVPAGGTATADFDLVPDTSGNSYIEEMVWLIHADPNMVMSTTSVFALGAPDDSGFSLGRRGDVCLSVGRGDMTALSDRGLSGQMSDISDRVPSPAVRLSGWIHNVPGNDITVFDSDSVADGYWLYAGDDWAGPWTSLGHANGTQAFDIGSAGIDSARYLRIVCDSAGSSTDPNGGLDLDAVAYRSSPADIGSSSSLLLPPSSLPSVFPNPANRVLYVMPPPECRRVEIVDIAGRAVECYPIGAGQPSPDCGGTARALPNRFRIDLENAGLGPGVYLARFETAAGAAQRKFVVARP
jgi:hypothetical protein